MSIKAVIIDDEADARITLQGLLSEFCPEVEVLGLGSNVEEGQKLIEGLKPSLVFLDVEMPGGTGFDMLARFDQLDFDVIFTTAHSHYALKALKLSAIDYLLKPIAGEELAAAVNKASKSLEKDTLNQKMEAFLSNLQPTENTNPKIVIPSSQGFRVAHMKDVVRCQADRNYTYVHFSDGTKELASKTLKEFEEMLEQGPFFRTHQSHLINLDYVKNYIKGRNSLVELTTGEEIEIARSRKEAFLSIFSSRSPE